jgi:hypothetical protein
MRAIIAGSVVALCVIGCGGGGGGGTPTGRVCDGASTTPPDMPTDYAPSFTGKWVGTLTTTMNGTPNVGTAQLTITTSKKNVLGTDICPGLPAVVTSATEFDTVCFICPPMKVAGVCDAMVITYSLGSGTLSSAGAQLDASLSGTVAGCGYSFTFTQDFATGSRVPGLRGPESDAAEPVSLSDLVMQAAASTR